MHIGWMALCQDAHWLDGIAFIAKMHSGWMALLCQDAHWLDGIALLRCSLVGWHFAQMHHWWICHMLSFLTKQECHVGLDA